MTEKNRVHAEMPRLDVEDLEIIVSRGVEGKYKLRFVHNGQRYGFRFDSLEQLLADDSFKLLKEDGLWMI